MDQSRGTSGSAVMLDGSSLRLADVERVAREGIGVAISPGAIARMAASRSVVEAALTDGRAHYGINTGFGSLSKRRIAPEALRDLQANLVRSHAAGVGPPLPPDIVRAMMVILAASLCRGLSGVRPVVAERLVEMLNLGVTPFVPEIGSVGASGDLAPLAHAALVLLGEGQAQVRAPAGALGQSEPGRAAMSRAGIEPLTLEAKEGLALINGTHLMAARAALICRDFERVFAAGVAAAAMSIDACRATDAFLDARAAVARNQPGAATVAAAILSDLRGSQILPSHVEGDSRVQDPYSLRCAAPVLGAAWDAFCYVKSAVERELGAVTDNPLVFVPDLSAQHAAPSALVSAGNFHGMPLAIPLDTLAIAASHVAGIAERRVFFMLSGAEPETHLTPYLSPSPGLQSGLMIAQYTAAACCNEIIGLCTPASVSNIPTSAGMEDYNSFGPRSAAKAARAVELARAVVAIELICAAEGLDRQRPLRSGEGVERTHAAVRGVVPPFTADRPPSPDIEAVARLIAAGKFAPPEP